MTTEARAVLFHRTGDPDVLTIERVRLDDPGPGEVRIRVDALGLNRAEALFRAGRYYYQPTLPASRLGYEAAGVVESVGAGVTEFAPGDPVLTGPQIEMSAQGVYGDRIVLPVESVIPRPASVDAVTGAATWLTYATAYGGLVETGGLRPGEHVVITAASSGVGTAAIQVAARTGAVPIAVTRSGDKRRRLRDVGAAHVIVASEVDVPEEVRRLTGGRGAELIFDPVAGPELPALAEAASVAGTIVLYGWLGGQPMLMPLNWPLTIHGYANGHLSATVSGRRRINRYIEAGLRDGGLRPVVGKVFTGLERIVDAHRLMESNTHVGKIVVTVEH
ncbi:zinc-dependent alcohol dehydrogenase family protein [Plantactinospora endophytica]|uniref:Alcohol dehydrogenase n=1 Tax=Plantactinospora endophytica TaxID=673535 RepID=A0ABQ4E0F8_9ACTN|nr:zinc-dependent alcohol dehydrogenase family protein [Plantactinospora endophytica]GIG88158.1 alcohol dehydrogenase [Plantactinospora endophytica]